MPTLLIILLGTVLIQNSVTLVGEDGQTRSAIGTLHEELARLGVLSLSLTLSSLLGFGVEHYVLTSFALEYLRTPALLMLVAVFFFAARRFSRGHTSTEPTNVLAYISEHCAIWGLALFSAWQLQNWGEAFVYGLGAGLALSFLDAGFRAHRARFATAAVPFVFRGIPLDLITAGLMALALYGLAGF